MVSFSSLLLAAAAAGAAVMAAPGAGARESHDISKRQTPNSEGWHDGYWYMWWNDGHAPANYTNLLGGSYRVEWENIGNFVGGKGWNPGVDDRAIQISGQHEFVNNSYISVWGMMANPTIEYFIIENWGTFNPTLHARAVGTVECDGGIYDVAQDFRSQGFFSLHRYWSVRRDKRLGGVVHTACHFDYWRRRGLLMGEHQEQIVATEAYRSTGWSEITVADVT